MVAHRPTALGELHRLSPSRLGHQVDLLFPADVGDVGDPRPVRRPGGPLLVGAGRRRQGAGRPLLHRGREELAARREDQALSGRRDVEVLDVARRGNAGGTAVQAVRRDGDPDGCRRPVTIRVEEVQRPRLLEDDAPGGVAPRPAEVPGFGVGPGPGLAALGVVGIQVVRPRTVRGEEDPGADPHRIPVRPRVVGDPDEVPAGRLEDVQVLGPAPGIALPGAEIPEERRIDQPLSVRRPGAGAGARHREGRRQAPAALDFEEPAFRDPVPVAQRAEQDPPAVGRPVIDDVVVAPAGRHRAGGRIEGELFRHPRRRPASHRPVRPRRTGR